MKDKDKPNLENMQPSYTCKRCGNPAKVTHIFENGDVNIKCTVCQFSPRVLKA